MYGDGHLLECERLAVCWHNGPPFEDEVKLFMNSNSSPPNVNIGATHILKYREMLAICANAIMF